MTAEMPGDELPPTGDPTLSEMAAATQHAAGALELEAAGVHPPTEETGEVVVQPSGDESSNTVPMLDIPPHLLADPVFHELLRTRNIGGIYRALQDAKFSQRKIASATGQSQSEISEILAGRQVTSYDVLRRIAVGLRIPLGWIGLAYIPPDLGEFYQTAAAFSQQLTTERLAALDRGEIDDQKEAQPYSGSARVHWEPPAPGARFAEPMLIGSKWTGLEIAALRRGMGLSTREFADHLGISARIVSTWERGGADSRLRPNNQRMLDACLRIADRLAQLRFAYILNPLDPEFARAEATLAQVAAPSAIKNDT